MTDNMKKRATIIGVVAGVEVSMGIIEGIILPNLFERKQGEPFFIPSKSEIGKIGATLIVTGVISGYLSEYVLDKYKVKDENRAKVITAVAIGVNVIETFITYNLNRKWNDLGFPKMKQFAPAFAFLCLTSLVGGYASDNIIASLTPGDADAGSGVPGGALASNQQQSSPTVMVASMGNSTY